MPSTDWQLGECRQVCERRGHTVVASYADIDLSGYREVHRPEFERLLVDLHAGAFDAVMAWAIDRLTRKGCWGRDTVELLRGLQEAGVVLFTLEEDYDTSSARGKRRLAEDLSRAEEESEKISRRSRAGKEAAARRGAVHCSGPRPFGATVVVEPGTGRKVLEVVPGEAQLIRAAAERVLDGHSLRSTVLDWNAQGLRTTTGGEWTQQSLRNLLLQQRLVGDRVYRGEVVARDVLPVVLDRATFEGVSAVLRDPARRGAQPVRSYLLTGLVRCSNCGGRMRSNQAAGGPRRYACPPKPEGCNGRTILAEPLEAFVSEAVLLALDSPALTQALAAAAEADREVAGDPAAELRDAERRLDETRREYARGDLTRQDWAVMREELQRLIDDDHARMARATRRPPLARFAGAGLREQWPGLSLENQRQVIRAVLERVEVGPASRGRVFDPGRLSFTWRA